MFRMGNGGSASRSPTMATSPSARLSTKSSSKFKVEKREAAVNFGLEAEDDSNDALEEMDVYSGRFLQNDQDLSSNLAQLTAFIEEQRCVILLDRLKMFMLKGENLEIMKM